MRKRRSLGFADDYPTNFKAQITLNILTLLDQSSINVVLIPPNCTDCLQPLDVSVNKVVKKNYTPSFKVGMHNKYTVNAKKVKRKSLLIQRCGLSSH